VKAGLKRGAYKIEDGRVHRLRKSRSLTPPKPRGFGMTHWLALQSRRGWDFPCQEFSPIADPWRRKVQGYTRTLKAQQQRINQR
jgi:hypothetical protein